MSNYKHLKLDDIPPVPTDVDLHLMVEGKSFEDLAELMYNLEVRIEAAKAELAPLSAAYEFIRLRAIPTVSEDTTTTQVVRQFTPTYRGRVQLQSDLYVQVIDVPQAQEWLKDNGHGDLIKPTVNAGSLKAAMRSRIERGQGTPPPELFKVTPFKFAMIVKA